MNEAQLKLAGVTIRERPKEWQVVDGRKISSRHASYQAAFLAANKIVRNEVDDAKARETSGLLDSRR